MATNGFEKRSFAVGGIRGILFGDMPLEVWGAKSAEGQPWIFFAEARNALHSGDKQKAVEYLNRVLLLPVCEPRHYAQAWRFLRQLGVYPAESEEMKIYGVAVEVAWDRGLDILAVFADRTARYFNYSGAAVVWERPDNSFDAETEAVLRAGEVFLPTVESCEAEHHPPPPSKGEAMISFLTPGGIRFVEGNFDVLASGLLSGPVMQSAMQLMQALIRGVYPGGPRELTSTS